MFSRSRGREYRDILVVKLGGSVITYKNRAFQLRLDTMKKLSSFLGRLNSKGYSIVVVLGGGSYGHEAVKSCKENGASTAETVSITSIAMNELALAVADMLSLEGLYPVIFPPHAFCKPENLKPNCDWSTVAESIQKGITPILYGDIYLKDESYGIVSGDELVVEAACSLGAVRAVYLTDVNGVIDANGSTIPLIKLGQHDISNIIYTGVSRDVTGGMKRKLEAIKANACKNLKILIINAFRINSPEEVLAEETSIGTLVIVE